MGLWYLSSLLEHDSNYSHQGARLEQSAKSAETASPQLIRHGPLTSALRLFEQSLMYVTEIIADRADLFPVVSFV